MKSHFYRKYILLLISIILQNYLSDTSKGCGYDWDADDELRGILFAPEVINEKENTPFFLSYHVYYGDFSDGDIAVNKNNSNLQSWFDYFESKIKKEKLNNLIINSSEEQVALLIKTVNSKKENTQLDSLNLPQNELINIVKYKKSQQFLQYLLFAKKCEKYNPKIYDWYDEPNKDSVKIDNNLYQQMEKVFQKTGDKFLAQRYLFQLIRLNYFYGLYQKGIDLAASSKKQMQYSLNTMYYRIKGYEAGCYNKLQNYSKANYIYANIFGNCKEEKSSAGLSFHPQNDSDWTNCLKECKNNAETENLWQLYGIYDNDLTAIKKIYGINPKSDKLNLLLVRAINNYESKTVKLKNPESIYRKNNYEEEEQENELTDFSENDSEYVRFIHSTALAANTQKPDLWNLASGYLYFLHNDFNAANYCFTKINHKTADTLIQQQLRLLEVILKVAEQKNISSEFEASLVKDLEWLKDETPTFLRKNAAFLEVMYRLSNKYPQENLKNLLCKNAPAPDIANAEKLIAFFDLKKHSTFEKFILNNYRYKTKQLHNYLATTALYQYDLKKALHHFKLENEEREIYIGDPFIMRNIDCHDCDHDDPKKHNYTQVSFTERLIKLETLINGDSSKNPNYYYLLANAYYNMTYYGNSRELSLNSVTSEVYDYSGDEEKINLNDNYYNCNRAKAYYLKAMERSKDNEFKAKCYFMAAKCALNNSYANSEEDLNQKETLYFVLKKSFNKTRYYSEVIKECSYLRDFVCNN